MDGQLCNIDKYKFIQLITYNCFCVIMFISKLLFFQRRSLIYRDVWVSNTGRGEQSVPARLVYSKLSEHHRWSTNSKREKVPFTIKNLLQVLNATT